MTTALSITGLTKTFPGGVKALKGIDLTVKQGDFFALLGPNGAGKSTTIGIISSLINKSSGQVSVFGHDIDTELAAAKACIGLVPQEFNFNQFEPVAQIVMNQAGFYGLPRALAKQRTEKFLRQLALWDKRNTASRQLSGGMKRRLMIARALVHEPALLILDEPTAGVDIESRRGMWDFLTDINAAGTTIILTTHYLEEAEQLCRNIAIIDHGEVIRDTSMKALLNDLDAETFVLDLAQPVSAAPTLADCDVLLRDDHTLEISMPRRHGLNALFCELDKQDIKVASMRNKTNRLEQLFLGLTQEDAA